MRAFVTRKEFNDWYPVGISEVIAYVRSNNKTDLFVPVDEYFEIFDACFKTYKTPIDIVQGRTEEDYPFFMFAGIKIIMLPKDKIDSYTILK